MSVVGLDKGVPFIRFSHEAFLSQKPGVLSTCEAEDVLTEPRCSFRVHIIKPELRIERHHSSQSTCNRAKTVSCIILYA